MSEPLTEEQLEGIAERMTRKLIDENRARWVDPETHDKHHQWAARKMQDEEDIRAMRRRIITSSATWALILALGFAATALWRHFLTLIGTGN